MSDHARDLTLLIETTGGVFRRRVLPAKTLASDRPSGLAAEEATRSAAAMWGLPDFVFQPESAGTGSRRREVGDAIVWVGRMGACVQVKARAIPSGDQERERSWLDSRIKKGIRQAHGTIRAIRERESVSLWNERGRRVSIHAANVSWTPVVVLDHPGVNEYVPPAGAVVLLRRDWEFLFDQLRSTYAVVEYLERVRGDGPVRLGDEPVRYYELAAADAVADASPLDERIAALGGAGRSAPLLPQAPVGHDEGPRHLLVRAILEDIAVVGGPEQDWTEVLGGLAGVDAVPVAYRRELGDTVLGWLQEVTTAGEAGILWRFRWHVWPGRPFLIFAAASRFEKAVQRGFSLYVTLRHQQFIELLPERALETTIGVLLTPRSDGLRPWDTTMFATRGDQALLPGDRKELERLWGKLGERVITDPE